MTDSKSTDHWRFLARQLGAASETEPEEAAKPTEPAEPAEPAAEQFPTTEPQPESAPAEETTAALEPSTPSIPIPAPKPPAPSRLSPPKPKPRNHWRDLANSLGIEVSEPEPEEPEPAEEIMSIDLRTPAAPPEPPALVTSRPEPMERDFDAGRGRPDARRGHRRPSLFDDPDLSLDTPGVLDAVFDEIEPAATAEPEDIFEHRPPESPDDELNRRDRSPSRALDELFSDEVDGEYRDEAPVEDELEPIESAGSSIAEDEDKSARRRRRPRRRRRSGRRDQEPAEEKVRGAAEDEDLAEEEFAESRRAAPVRESQVVDKAYEDEEPDDEDHLADEDEDDEEGSGERRRLKHKKIPTWQQAVDAIIAVNMESRARNPSGGGGGGRGSGRRWRK